HVHTDLGNDRLHGLYLQASDSRQVDSCNAAELVLEVETRLLSWCGKRDGIGWLYWLQLRGHGFQMSLNLLIACCNLARRRGRTAADFVPVRTATPRASFLPGFARSPRDWLARGYVC